MSESLPIFVLPLAALPGEEVPLHIFEPRYRALAAHCLTEESEFGILLREDGGVREIGCAAKIGRIVGRHEDGSLDLVATATRRFELAGEITEGEYPAAPVTWVQDDPMGPHDDPDPTEVEELFTDLATRVTGAIPDYSMELPTSFAIAGKVAFGPQARQGLLELRSEQDRLELLARLLRAALARLSQAELRQAQAHSNGKVHFE